ncbi:hypothetical protein LTR15_009430 [Elasticomyces elasticus]|nr:hypothetical protein LTR15_009430 [Elasticomyces elasticus]
MNMGSTATLDLDNTNDSNPSPVSYIEPLAPNVHHTPIDNYHSSMASTLKPHCEALEFESHVSVLLSQTRKLTDRCQIILDFLNANYEVKRCAITEFEPPVEYDGLLQHWVEPVAVTTVAQESAMLVKLREALVLESGGLLFDKVRARLLGVWEKGEVMAREAIATRLAGKEVKSMVIQAYGRMLGPWAQVMAEAGQGFKEIEAKYVMQLKPDGGAMFGDGNLEWKAGLEMIRMKVDELPAKMKMAAAVYEREQEEYEEGLALRMEFAKLLVHSVAAECAKVRVAYEAAFASALKIAPEVFAYPDWCAAEPKQDWEHVHGRCCVCQADIPTRWG